MRPLNRNEKVLLALCLVAVFAVVNLYLFQRIFGTYRDDQKKVSELEDQIVRHQTLVDGGPAWAEKVARIDRTLPPFESAGKTQSALLKEIQDDAFEHGFKITKTTLLEPEDQGLYHEIAVSVNLYGEMAKLEKWCTRLQRDPRKFRHIKKFELEIDLRSRAKEPHGKCEVTLARWFRPKNRS